MKHVAISELKSKLSQYLRLVKSGEEIEIQERGIPIAHLTKTVQKVSLTVISPRKEPRFLQNFKFSVQPKEKFDSLKILLEDREKR